MDPVRPAVVGTACFVVALVVILLLRDELAADAGWWAWTAALGAAGGAIGCVAALRVRRARTRSSGVEPAQAVGTSASSEPSTGPVSASEASTG